MADKIPQTVEELANHLREQVTFIRSSMKAYDEGFEGEAKRLATSIRVLVHDARWSASLLEQLGVKESLQYYSHMDPAQSEHAKIFDSMPPHYYRGRLKYYPNPDAPRFRLPFKEWWSRRLMFNTVNGVSVTCSDTVLWVANQDGGSHVDRSLDAAYHDLSRHNAFGWSIGALSGKDAVFNGPQLAIVRQTAGELEKTLAERFKL